MLDDNYVTMEIDKTKHIALVAHDGKKKELVDWCDRNKEILKGHFLCGTTDCRTYRASCKGILQWTAWWRSADRSKDSGRADRFYDFPVGSA